MGGVTMLKIMRMVCVCLVLLTVGGCVEAATPINEAGYFKNIKLCGKVRVVRWNGDIKVQIVNSFPDLRVKVVDSFPDDIGEWEFVEYGENFTVEFVDSFPDIKIEYVESFPGVE
jgi:hypothetical protein